MTRPAVFDLDNTLLTGDNFLAAEGALDRAARERGWRIISVHP